MPADLGAALAALQASNERSGALTRRAGPSSLTPRATPRFTPRQPGGNPTPHSDLKVGTAAANIGLQDPWLWSACRCCITGRAVLRRHTPILRLRGCKLLAFLLVHQWPSQQPEPAEIASGRRLCVRAPQCHTNDSQLFGVTHESQQSMATGSPEPLAVGFHVEATTVERPTARYRLITRFHGVDQSLRVPRHRRRWSGRGRC